MAETVSLEQQLNSKRLTQTSHTLSLQNLAYLQRRADKKQCSPSQVLREILDEVEHKEGTL
jgi:hypothetical protein